MQLHLSSNVNPLRPSSLRVLKRSCGLTLVELLVVISIVGILLALLLPANATPWGVIADSRLPDNQLADKYAAGPAYVLGTTFKDGFNIEELPLDSGEEHTYAESFGSLHPGGANFVFCDGGVRFVFDSIDPGVMNAMATRNGVSKDGRVDPIIHDSPF